MADLVFSDLISDLFQGSVPSQGQLLGPVHNYKVITDSQLWIMSFSGQTSSVLSIGLLYSCSPSSPTQGTGPSGGFPLGNPLPETTGSASIPPGQLLLQITIQNNSSNQVDINSDVSVGFLMVPRVG